MIRRHIFSLAFALVILWLSFSSPGTFSGMDLPDIPYLDKLVHMGMYFMFTFLLIIENRGSLSSPVRYLVLSVIPFLFGVLIEILQGVLTDYRSGDPLDVAGNIMGTLLAIGFWLIIKRLFFKNI